MLSNSKKFNSYIQYLENEKKKIVKDYSELLNKPFRLEMTIKIKEEVRKSFPNAQEEELNHFSNNVYVYATLRACNIDEQEIVEQLLYLNNRYFDEMQEDGVVKNTQITNANLEYLQKLNDKYILQYLKELGEKETLIKGRQRKGKNKNGKIEVIKEREER